MFFINLWNVAGALHSPNSMWLHLKNPKFPMVKAVYCFKASSIAICQNLAFKSRQEKYPVPTKLSMHTNTTALHQGLWFGQVAPASNISSTCAWTSSTIGGGILWNLSLKGSSSITLISCFTRSVQPNSPGSKEKMSWYSASRTWVAAWFLSDHLSRPDKSSCWKSISFLHSTNSFVCWIPWLLSSFSNVLGATSTWGTPFVATTWVTLTPVAMVIRMAVRFFTMTATPLLLVVISV